MSAACVWIGCDNPRRDVCSANEQHTSMSESLVLQDKRHILWSLDTMYDERCERADIQLMLY